ADTLDPWRDRWRRRNLVIDHRGRKLMPAERTELGELTELVRLVRSGEKLLSPQEVLNLKVNLAAETLYHLIDAIPVAERDRQEIYPGDFLRPVVSEPLPEKMWLPDLGLRDYSEPALLLFKSGRYERVIRQKAASAARSIASDVSYALLLVPTQTQWVEEFVARLDDGNTFSDESKPSQFDLDGRIAWTEHNLSRIIDIGAAVLWGDKPDLNGIDDRFQFAAACTELVGVMRRLATVAISLP